MELKRNIARTADEIEKMANDAISMMKEITNNDIIAVFFGSPKPNEPHYQNSKLDCYECGYGTKDSVFVPQDVCPCVVAKFKNMGYYVWSNSDYQNRVTYWVTCHDIRPHPWFGRL